MILVWPLLMLAGLLAVATLPPLPVRSGREQHDMWEVWEREEAEREAWEREDRERERASDGWWLDRPYGDRRGA
jgi:hypothetical protein